MSKLLTSKGVATCRVKTRRSTEFVKVYGAKGLAWVKVKEGGEWQSPIAKFFSDDERAAIAERLNLEVNDVAVFVADSAKVTNAALAIT